MRNAATYINQTSGKVEYYTPAHILEAARATMGTIDLDPASSPAANANVQSGTFYSRDGLTSPWFGNVWLNHPFGRAQNPAWIGKLLEEFSAGNVKQACCITFAATSERWFQPLFDFPLCFLAPRTNYLQPDGSLLRGVTKGSVVTYLGANVPRFVENFRRFGRVVRPISTEDIS